MKMEDEWRRYLDASDVVEAALISLGTCILAAAIASVFAPRGTKSWKNHFCCLLFFSAVCCEFYFLGQLALKLPSEMPYILVDCRASKKGGKTAGSFRDCMDQQGSKCTKDQPCTPCDQAIQRTHFDNVLWPNECQPCTRTNPGLCSKTQPQWCRGADGSVELCKRCCLLLGTDSNGSLIEDLSVYEDDECAFVFDSALFAWDDSGFLGCDDPAFPLKTRFGCCSASARPKDSAPVLLGTGEEVPACSFTGPNEASWGLCKEEFEAVMWNETLTLQVPLGCRLFSNGAPSGEQHCRKPVVRWSLMN